MEETMSKKIDEGIIESIVEEAIQAWRHIDKRTLIEPMQNEIKGIKRKLGMEKPQCTCPRAMNISIGAVDQPTEIDVNCPIHGKSTWKETVDLPLNVRVAKALGENPYPEYVGKPPLPDYAHDLTAAMGALEEYKRKFRPKVAIELLAYASTGMMWCVCVNIHCVEHKSLPQAICEAITKHAEGK
jgi:hypothetical protein